MSETITAEHQKQLDEDMAAYPSNIADTINPDTNDVNAVSLSPFLKYLLLVDHRYVDDCTTISYHLTNFPTMMRFAYIGKVPKATPVPKNTNEARTTHKFL